MIAVVCGILIRDGRVLVGRRRGGRHHGLWEFPGGKLAEHETAAVGLERELREELDLRCVVGAFIARASDNRVELSAYRVDAWEGTPHAAVHDTLRWVGCRELESLPMPAVDRALLDEVIALTR